MLKFLYVFGKFLQFKMVLLVTINTIINVIRFIMEWKKKKGPEHVVYSYEQAHHQHHYDEHHHVDPVHEDGDKGWLSGLWSRSGSQDGGRADSMAEHAHDIAYSAQKPSQSSAYSRQTASQDPAQKSMQIEAKYEHKPWQQASYYPYVQDPNSNGQRSL
jgi:hypothetical protein